MQRPLRIWLSVAVAIATFGIGVNVGVWGRAPRATVHVDAEPPTPPPVDPGPPCIHQTCSERPAHLYCQGAVQPHYACADYLISYEHHCTCDAWAPR